MDEKELEGFRGYVLYGRDARDLIERIVAFSNGCSKLVFDASLSSLAREVCRDLVAIESIKSSKDIEECLAKGKYAVLPLKSPLEGVKTIALIVGKLRSEKERH